MDAGACRRLLDVEGWTNDITLLRKALEAIDRKLHQMRLSSRLPGGIDCIPRTASGRMACVALHLALSFTRTSLLDTPGRFPKTDQKENV